MKAQIIGLGWVTPLGRDIAGVFQNILDEVTPPTTALAEAEGREVFRIVPETIKDVAALPRLRRSSVISHFAVAAAQDAMRQAALSEEQLARTTLIFAASDGAVIYTRRFYGDVVQHGPSTGSPLLFPETVYNAPASHVAGTVGLSGEVLTLVGDSSVALTAMNMAVEALQQPDVDFCLVVTAQEMDWISAEAYDRWRLVQGVSAEATCFSEGAAAMLLARDVPGIAAVRFSHGGFSYGANREAERALGRIFAEIEEKPDVIISSSSGTRFDQVEERACQHAFPETPTLRPKMQWGDALAASALQQVILGALLIQKGHYRRVLVPVAGFNGQANALLLTEAGVSPKDDPNPSIRP